MLNGARSDSTVRSQVRRGQPALQFQSLGRGALRARLWSMDGLARDMTKVLETSGADDVC